MRHAELTVATQDHIVSTEPGRDELSNPGGLDLLRLMRANAYTTASAILAWTIHGRVSST